MAIRNFIYLDNQKLRSLSSQLFEGVTERIVSNVSNALTNMDEQAGPPNSGQTLADIISKEASSSEMKFLADHAYNILEMKLETDGLLKDADHARSTRKGNFLIKVTGLICLNDMSASTSMLRNFNDLGLAIWRVGNEEMSADATVASDKDAKRKAIESSLQLNEKVASAAAHVIEFGFRGLLEIFMRQGSQAISAPLKREYLRESEEMFIQKYSRMPNMEFTMVGLAVGLPHTQQTLDLPDVKDAADPKNAMRNLALHMSTVENEYVSAKEGEIVIDPIAVYSELEI